jgi:hypothetical protein
MTRFAAANGGITSFLHSARFLAAIAEFYPL